MYSMFVHCMTLRNIGAGFSADRNKDMIVDSSHALHVDRSEVVTSGLCLLILAVIFVLFLRNHVLLQRSLVASL